MRLPVSATPGMSWVSASALIGVLLISRCQSGFTQETPYFVTDHHHLPDPGALGLASYNVAGDPKIGNGCLGQ